MCGIVGLVTGRPVAGDLINALGRLEYRGYDSAGIALTGSQAGAGLAVRRAVGRAAALNEKLLEGDTDLTAGIAHTRWATHGRPEERNAHPHVWEGIAVVHNGIIENYGTLRAALQAAGHVFASDTDSEVVPHLIADARRAGLAPIDAVRAACAALHGAYAIAVLFDDQPGCILVARSGSPVMVGTGADTGAVASDPLALNGFCDRYTALNDGDIAEVTRQGITILDANGNRANRAWQPMIEDEDDAILGQFEHFTRREIAEQPKALMRTAAGLIERRLPDAIAQARRLVVVACGSSLYAASTARFWLERLSGIPCDIEIASEFRYREAPISNDSVAILVSQSGETADTLAALSLFKEQDIPIVAVVNVLHSTMAREATLVWPTSAGREQGVAATKSFTTQLAALLRLGVAFSVVRGRDKAARDEVLQALDDAPEVCAGTEELEPAFAELAHVIAAEREALFIGRRDGAAIAAEAALKMKELSYIRADAYAAGELKHGPIALIRAGSPVVVFAATDDLLPKTVSNAQEVKARGAHVIAVTDAEGASAFEGTADNVIALPGRGVARIFAQSVAQQLLAYHTALALNCDVDRPRNLAKSVTVE